MTTKRTKVRKCNIFFERPFQTWLNCQANTRAEDAGIRAALEFAKVIAYVCLTGLPLERDEADIPKLPSAIQPCHKLFLSNWSNNGSLMGLVAYSTRAEIVIGFCADTDRAVLAEATFYEKGRDALGKVEMAFILTTGAFAGGVVLLAPDKFMVI